MSEKPPNSTCRNTNATVTGGFRLDRFAAASYIAVFFGTFIDHLYTICTEKLAKLMANRYRKRMIPLAGDVSS